MPGHVFLEGERVDLRVVERDDPDLTALGHVRNDPEFRRALGFDAPWPESRVEEFVASTATDDSSTNLLVCLDGDDAPGDGRRPDGDGEECVEIAGAVNLFDVDRVAGTLSYWLFDECRGEGYATEAIALVVDHAFERLGLHRIEAEAFTENEPSRRLLDRLGFVHEGTARECRFAGGEYRGRERYGLLEDEWRDEEGTR